MSSLRPIAADLHLHTALSPCAEDEMTPQAIVDAARQAGLQLIAICDHNTAGNTAAVQEAARLGEGEEEPELGVLAGIEITTAEEAHVVGLFPDAAAAVAAGREVCETLPLATPASRRFGEQWLLDAAGHVLGQEPKMLNAPCTLTLEQVVALIHKHGGLAVAAHLDRPSYSVLSQLGIFPEDSGFDAIEVSAAGRETKAGRLARYGLPLVTSSDSHFLSDIGICRTLCQLAAPTFEELARALRGEDGRGCRIA